jgi:hypothetical protein
MDVVEYISIFIQVSKNVEHGRIKTRIQYILVEVAAPNRLPLIFWLLTDLLNDWHPAQLVFTLSSRLSREFVTFFDKIRYFIRVKYHWPSDLKVLSPKKEVGFL